MIIDLYSTRKPYKPVLRVFLMMLKRFVLFLMALLLISSTTHAKENFTSFNIIDGTNGEKFADIIGHVTVQGEETRVVLVRNGTLVLDSEKAVEIVLDLDATEAPDYYYFGFPEGNSLNFFPIGKVRGSIYDTLDNLVAKADILFDCDKPMTILFPENSDRYGGFSSYLPLGKCIISTTDGNMLGKNEIIVEQGKAYDIDLVLNKSLNSHSSFYFIIFGVVVILFIFYYKNKRLNRHKKKKPTNKNLDSVLKTLNEKEKGIVLFLREHGNKSSATNVRRALQIPKTSFTRMLTRLEEKKIIVLEKDGSFIKIKLAEWLYS